MKTFAITVIALVFLCPLANTQEGSPKPASDEILDIFLDCVFPCDLTYLRQEMGFVNFMQNRQEAQVFLQLVAQRTGTGGREFRLQVQGGESNQFNVVNDTLIFYTANDATDNERRDAILQTMKKAVLPYILQTSVADNIEYSVIEDVEGTPLNSSIKDPWNYWTFQVRINSFLRGESQSDFVNLNNSLNINRTTEESKFDFFARYNYNRSSFDFDEETVISSNRSVFGRMLYVHSISDHWSIGASFGAFSSTFSNVDFGYGPDPTIEYNVFPYRESSRRQFTIKYNVGPSYRNYTEETIFDKLSEWYWEQELEVNYAQIKNWGNINIQLEYKNYLHDFGQLEVGINPSLEWNITRGLNIDLYTSLSYIANQRNIQKTEADASDIILQNRQRQTSFEYFGSIGLSYRFGSAYNNIVNTRFTN